MKINVKTNLRQYLTEEIKPQNHSVKNIPKCRPRNYYINKNNNYIKNAKMMINNRKNNIIQNNMIILLQKITLLIIILAIKNQKQLKK